MVKFSLMMFIIMSIHLDGADECFPGRGWNLDDSVKLTSTLSAQVWKQKQKGPYYQRSHRARLIIVQGKRCLAKQEGVRKNGAVLVPFGSNSLSVIKKNGLKFLQTISDYSHGYSEQTTSLFTFDASKKSLQQVFSGVTSDTSPYGEESLYPIEWKDLNGDGKLDFNHHSRTGKVQYIFKNKSFEKK